MMSTSYRSIVLLHPDGPTLIGIVSSQLQRRSPMGLKQRLLEPHRAAGYINLAINASSM
jgi:hypothetical protein